MDFKQHPTTNRTSREPDVLRQNIVDNLYYSRGANVQSAGDYDIYMALSRSVRNHLVERYRRTVDMRYAVNPRFVYYLSAEYLLGAWLGWRLLPLILILSSLIGALVGIALIALRGHDRQIPIPFGPFLAGAGWIALIWGETLTRGYLAYLGIG